MRSDKYNRALKVYDGFCGDRTLTHINTNINKAYPAAQALTGKQYGGVMAVADLSYKDGKTTGLEVCDDCVWIQTSGKNGLLVPLAALKSIKIIDRAHPTDNRVKQHCYTMDFAENY